MTTVVPEEIPGALCSLCGEQMQFVGRSLNDDTPLFYCDTTQEGNKMPDDGQAYVNLVRRRLLGGPDPQFLV